MTSDDPRLPLSFYDEREREAHLNIPDFPITSDGL